MLTITEEQALHFRANRSGLVEGADSAVSAARAVLGVQAQQLAPALFALCQRTTGQLTAAELEDALHGQARGTLVRTWGQRDTLHIYDAAHHWRRVIAAGPAMTQSGRRGPMPDEALLAAGLQTIKRLGRPVTRKDLHGVAPADYLEAVTDVAGYARQTPDHFAAGRILWKLAHLGDVCAGPKMGSEQTYAARDHWFPDLPWSEEADVDAAGTTLAREYLAVYGPATVKDVAHHFGTKATPPKRWFEQLRDEGALVDVDCAGRKGLVALARDAEALTANSGEWPTRLLPKYDTMLMAHADKSWTVPDEGDRKAIWKKAANVLATVLWRGRLVATWSHKARTRDVIVTVTPLTGWNTSLLPAVESEAQALAQHLERAGGASVVVES